MSQVYIKRGNAFWLANALNYGTHMTVRGVIFKTDYSLNGVNMCYEFSDPPSTFTITENLVSVWKDMSIVEPMAAFNLNNGPFLETLSVTIYT